MPALSTARLAELLLPFYEDPAPLLLDQLSTYLDLLLKWNKKTNLTAIREPEEIVRRHFGESLFAARHLHLTPGQPQSLLDLGSGAGFPGIPIQLAHPTLDITLAESQNKKATFLREVIRSLHLTTQVWPTRAELMPEQRRFDIVTLRAVDNPDDALQEAASRVTTGGWIVHLDSVRGKDGEIPLPESQARALRVVQIVPRGTFS